MRIFWLLVAAVFFFSNNLSSESILDSKSKQELFKSALNQVKQLEETRKEQLLILKDKYLKETVELDFVKNYLKFTQKCLKERKDCLSLENNHLANFYTELNQEDFKSLNDSLSRLKNNPQKLNYKRAFILNKLFESLKLGIEEAQGPNNDSKQGDFIKAFFKSAGIYDPEQELGERVKWAWCSAFVSSVINQAGSNFSYLDLKELNHTCKNKLKHFEHCHPVQVDFILNWAENKNILEQLTLFKLRSLELLPGDILIQYNHQRQRSTHNGFFLAYQGDWIYSIEGNAGPFINDVLEDNWQAIKDLNLKPSEYQRLLDRLTIVKRPITSWDYFISIGTF